ncbi:hypothetical protein ACFQBQ_17660 [Granulicella cerasi]|uniref:Uncharacterized protein n=1 Tax=Granulicella cerasi TaxID=741063 RepID=A0ABW1ZE74_9BACT|nr:hypothetical protein [Granulicella cerasi]
MLTVKLTLVALAAPVAVATGFAQVSTLPATAPTAQPAPIAAQPTITPGRRAFVTFDDGMLNVRADNSSLNVILRDVARVTGMKITGGVNDERVFGNYGPADPGTVLATLLGGTGVNVLVLGDETNAPRELVLTPRTGGPTPPSPTAPQYDNEATAEPVAAPVAAPMPRTGAVGFNANRAPRNNDGTTPVPAPVTSNGTTPVPDPKASPISSPQPLSQPANNVLGSSVNSSPTASTMPTTNSVPIDSLPTPTTTTSSDPGIVDSPNPAPAGTTTNPNGNTTSNPATPTDTNPGTATTDNTTTNPTTGAASAPGTTTDSSGSSTLTPEQIYQKLLDMQKAKAAASPQ